MSASQIRKRLSDNAVNAYYPAANAFSQLQHMLSALAAKQWPTIPLSRQDRDEENMAIDGYVSSMRSYRAAMSRYKTRMLKDGEIKRGGEGWTAFERAEWKDGQLDLRQPIAPPTTFRLGHEEAQLHAFHRAFEVKRARCIQQHCQILHTDVCYEANGVAEGQSESFYYFSPRFAH
ncbi:MAG: hypothetical protein M1826_006813 [Phylliscum demangeonii]|nr:MAG: hypothetical protein M1826_006813 [Phylliscum demangeonii]